MSRTATQTRAVLNWLQTRGPITDHQAKEELGISRVAARINDIKNGRGVEPHAIESKLVRVRNRHGETCRVAEYRLAPKVIFDQRTGQGCLALPQEGPR